MMLDTRRAQFCGSLVVVALLAATRLHATEFVLDEDKVIDVPSNETLEYSSLSGDAYKLTKTGTGKAPDRIAGNTAGSEVHPDRK